MTTKNKVNIDTQILDLGCRPILTITLIYPRYRLLKEFVETKISLRLGGLHVKNVCETQVVSLQVNFGKTVELSNVLNVFKKN